MLRTFRTAIAAVALAAATTVGAQEHIGCRTTRRDLASIVGDDITNGSVVMHEECATTQARGLRFDETQHGLHSNRCIDGRATRREHFDTGIDSKRIGSRDQGPGSGAHIRLRLNDR